MRLLGFVLIFVLMTQASGRLFCYSFNPGEESMSIVPCFSASCYSEEDTIATNLHLTSDSHPVSLGGAKKGCADRNYEEGCRSGQFMGLATEHVCFCNTFLCNASINLTPSLLLPLSMLACFLLMTL